MLIGYRQAENLVHLNIKQENGLAIHMITEAGIIGKIGLNNRGVGCALNAIRAKGVSFEKLPCHLALRAILESLTREEAIATLEKSGVASACHILVADSNGGTGLECSSDDIAKLEMDLDGVVVHTNHYILKRREDVVAESLGWLPDTQFRLKRAKELLNAAEKPSEDALTKILSDEIEGDGASICRRVGKDNLLSLFGIVMNLVDSSALVLLGRPARPIMILLRVD
jgi:isopenicillin-N N-acyltransferase like protein